MMSATRNTDNNLSHAVHSFVSVSVIDPYHIAAYRAVAEQLDPSKAWRSVVYREILATRCELTAGGWTAAIPDIVLYQGGRLVDMAKHNATYFVALRKDLPETDGIRKTDGIEPLTIQGDGMMVYGQQ